MHCAHNEVHALHISQLLVVNADGCEQSLKLVLAHIAFREVLQLRKCSVDVLLNVALVLALLFVDDLVVQVLVLLSVVHKSSSVVPILNPVYR